MKPTILGFYLRKEIRTGGHKRYLELLNSLSNKGYSVTVLIGNSIDNSDYSFKTIPLKPVNKGRILPYSIKQMFRVLLTIMSLPSAPWVTIVFGESNYFTMLLTKIVLKSKIIFAYRSNSYKARKDQYLLENNKLKLKHKLQLSKMKKLERKITSLSDKIIFQTEFDRNDIILRSGGDISKSIIIPNSVRESWFNKGFKGINTSKGLESIIYLGSFDNRKGVIYLLRAMAILKSRGITPKLDLFGYGNQKAGLINFIEKSGLTESVKIHGKLNDPIKVIGSYDLMIVPSIYDSYPNVILESIFTGTPVIASDNSGMKAILEHQELLFKTGDPNDIAVKIEKLYSCCESYKNIKDICNERCEIHDFVWCDKFEEVLM